MKRPLILVTNDDGVTAPGRDVAEQARGILRALDGSLKAAKLTRSQVVSTNVYLTDLRLLDAADIEYQRFFAGALPARTVLQAILDPPEARICISAVAWRGNPERQPATGAVLAGDTLYLSAGIPGATGSIQQQVDQVMLNQEETLKAA